MRIKGALPTVLGMEQMLGKNLFHRGDGDLGSILDPEDAVVS